MKTQKLWTPDILIVRESSQFVSLKHATLYLFAFCANIHEASKEGHTRLEDNIESDSRLNLSSH
jgi:hypothetical protein